MSAGCQIADIPEPYNTCTERCPGGPPLVRYEVGDVAYTICVDCAKREAGRHTEITQRLMNPKEVTDHD